MADTIKSNMEHSNGTTEVIILDGAGSNIVYTVIAITICNTRSGDDETFDLFINDKVLNSQVTNKNGSTSIFTFEKGEYYFKIYQKSNLLGKVNFCLSINA